MNVVLTQDGKRRLAERLDRLEAEVLPSLREQLWDRDRDGRVDAAMESALSERRRLMDALSVSRTAEDLPDDPEVVELGDWVRVEGEDGDVETFRIVHPIEASLDAARISYDSPLAQVLLGRRHGDEVEMRTRFARPFRYRIVESFRQERQPAA